MCTFLLTAWGQRSQGNHTPRSVTVVPQMCTLSPSLTAEICQAQCLLGRDRSPQACRSRLNAFSLGSDADRGSRVSAGAGALKQRECVYQRGVPPVGAVIQQVREVLGTAWSPDPASPGL